MSIKKGKKFPYGIHVKDMKDLCRDKPIEQVPASDLVYISMSLHIGAPSVPIVNVGDKVKKGQLIAKENGPVSANVYSSVNGEVVSIEDINNGLGLRQKYVIIKNDKTDGELLFDQMTEFSPSALVERIRLAGIVGLGGAGFPTAVKLTPKNPLEFLIINGAECEPYLNCDFRLMIERTDDIYKGIKYTAKALGINKIVIGIEANKPEAIKAFEKYDDIDVVILKKQYPMGSEKHLIYCTTGRKVPTGKMPFDVGCCVHNVKTMIACYEAIELNKPFTEVYMTVSGKGVNNQKNIKTLIGTPYQDILDFCGGLNGLAVKFVAGGPMMGKALLNLNHYTRKTASGLLALTAEETNATQPSNCINCAVCAKNCPMRLMPMYIESYAQSGNFEMAEKYGAMNCIECGSCAFNCPAKRSLVQSISFAKAKIKEMKQNGR